MPKEAHRLPLEAFTSTLFKPDTPITLFTLRDALDTALTGRENVSQQQLRGIVDVIGSPLVLPQILSSIDKDPEAFAAVQERSYGHEAGFDRIELAGEEEYDLRLHGWWPEGDFTEQAHDHRWKSASRVVKGVLQNNLFVVSAQGEDVQEFTCSPADAMVGSHVVPTDLVRLRQISPNGTIITEDESYSLSERTIHQARSRRGEPTITAHLRGRSLRPSSRFFSPEGQDVPPPQVRELDLKDSLQRVNRTLYR